LVDLNGNEVKQRFRGVQCTFFMPIHNFCIAGLLVEKLPLKNVTFFLFFLSFTSTAQPLVEFNKERLQTDRRLMLTLGSWSLSNIVGSGIAWASSNDAQSTYFHQMNVAWNVVNLGLAIPGYIKAKRSNPDLGWVPTLREQQRTEKVFLFNTALDLTYMSAGILLRSEANSKVEKQDQFMGFGNSLLVQGGFLFLFDLTAYIIHSRHHKTDLQPILERLVPSSSGLGFGWRLGAEHDCRGVISLEQNVTSDEANLHR
jgi:hypothetical protein